MHLLIQFYADSLETLQMFRSRSEDVHIVGYNTISEYDQEIPHSQSTDKPMAP